MQIQSKLVATIARKLGLNKGAPRVWLEGALPARAGFEPGTRYSATVDAERSHVVLRVDDQGIRIVSSKVKGESSLPVIDLNSKELLSMFEGMNAVRVVMLKGEIHVLPEAVEVKKRDRAKRLEHALQTGDISIGSVSHGIGVLSNALHHGFKAAGLKPRLAWACEIDEELAAHASVNNSAWNTETVALAMPVQQLAFADEYTLSRLEKPIVLESGLPCVAASSQGRTKKALAMAEDDPIAGHLVAAFIALVARVNPVMIACENVPNWYTTASASILRTQLRDLGYVLHERTIEGGRYAIEARNRTVLVAVTEGLDVDVDAMVAPLREVTSVGTILEDVPLDDPQWSTMSYLKDKEVRDKEAGKGFAMQIITPESLKVGVIGSGYMKRRSSEPMLQHPNNPDLLRLFTPAEHARLKGIPQSLIDGVTSKTTAHRMLGQSVIWPAFRHLGEHLGAALLGGIKPLKRDVVEEAADDSIGSIPLFA